MKKFMKVVLVTFVFLILFTSCGKKYKGLDTGVSGELDLMFWSGDGTYMTDIGHKDIPAEDFTGQNQAAAYAVAKAFNQKYPNVKINVYAVIDDGGGPEGYFQEIENFMAEHGKYPDVYASMNVITDLTKGMIADISIFKDDPEYQNLNPSLMNALNIYGFQTGVPQYILPWGVFVNRALAEQHNIDVPPVNWTIDQYTQFVSQSDNKTFWGAMDAPMSFIDTGSKDVSVQIATRTASQDYVNINTAAVRDLFDYMPRWARTAIWPQNDSGNMPGEIMDENWWWSYKFFIENRLLTLDSDPWMLGDAANANPDHEMRVKSDDWDVYPRPATKYRGTHIGLVVDPFVIHNYAMDDGNPELSDAEYEKLKLAYTFMMFWMNDNGAWQARADQQFNDNGVLVSAMNDSFPVVKAGEQFDQQMEIWYSSNKHSRLADKTKFPGFHEVLRLYQSPDEVYVSDKAFPRYVDESGSMVLSMYEWDNIYNAEVTGALRTDANWLDNVKAKLPDWNTTINNRFKKADADLRDSMKKFYGYTDEMFK